MQSGQFIHEFDLAHAQGRMLLVEKDFDVCPTAINPWQNQNAEAETRGRLCLFNEARPSPHRPHAERRSLGNNPRIDPANGALGIQPRDPVAGSHAEPVNGA